jgi:hypothetical protein
MLRARSGYVQSADKYPGADTTIGPFGASEL